MSGVIVRPAQFQLLAASAVAVTAPADTSENILATITIAAGLLGANGALRLSHNSSYTNSANAKTIRVRFGGIGGNVFQGLSVTTTASIGGLVIIQNRNSQASQVGWLSGTNSQVFAGLAANPVTATVNTALATTLVITGQKASAGETLTLESYLCEYLRA